MKTQDWIFAIGTVVLIIGLLPTVYRPNKPHVHTAVAYGCVLTAFAMGFGSLHLYLSAGLTSINALIWFVIAGQIWSDK